MRFADSGADVITVEFEIKSDTSMEGDPVEVAGAEDVVADGVDGGNDDDH